MIQPSGDPAWEPAHGRGLPAIPAPTPVEAPVSAAAAPVGAAEPEPARSWLGWSPTSWRTTSRPWGGRR